MWERLRWTTLLNRRPATYGPLASRLSRVEGDVHDRKNIPGEMKIMVARIDAQIPYLATKAEIAGLEVKIAGLEVKLDERPARLTFRASSRRC